LHELSDKLCFLHNSLRRQHLAQARMVSSNKCALWLFLPRREVPHLDKKVVSPKRGYSRPGEKVLGASVLSRVFSPRREIFCLGKEVFSPRRKWSWSRSVLWTIFGQTINFLLRRRVFSPERNLAFCFWLFNSFGMQCMNLLW